MIARIITATSIIFMLSACATRGHEMTKNLMGGNDAAVRGDYNAAVVQYEKALEAVEDSSAAKRNLGIVLVKVGTYARAKELLLQSTQHYPEDIEVHYYLGEAYRGLSSYSLAVKSYRKAIEIDGKDLRVQKALAWTYFKGQLYHKSLSIVEPLIQTNGTDVQLRLIAGSAYNKIRAFQKTISTLQLIESSNFKMQSADKISAESERALVMTTLAEAYLNLNNHARATAIYADVLKSRPFLAVALVGAAKCDLEAKFEARAISKLERAAKADPEAAEAHFLLGKLYENGDKNKSTFYYRRFLLLSKNDKEFHLENRVSRNALANLEKSSVGK